MKYRASKRAMACAIPPEVKRAVFERDGGECLNCHGWGIPEAHFIPRWKGGLGVEENILTLCRTCHDLFDNGPRAERERLREKFRVYLQSCYPDWDEEKLYYKKGFY